MHFTVAVKEKHIRDMVCPACEEPEISDEVELLHYFSTLDILVSLSKKLFLCDSIFKDTEQFF